MKRCLLILLCSSLSLTGLSIHERARAQPAPITGSSNTKPAVPDSDYAILKGKWVRPDGGYVITIRNAEADGKLDASYANPNPLPFARAQASRDGEKIKVFLELRAGGYNGSTYTLTLEPNGSLKGIYFQAVAQQKFEVYFTRAAQ